MPDQIPRLDRLARAATAAISAQEGAHWGSAGLIAPGWALTAAHVVRAAGAAPYTVTLWNGRSISARTGYLLSGVPDSGPVPAESDIALVRLLEDDTDHACVWLSDRGDPPSHEVRAYGWYVAGGKRGGELLDWNGVCVVAGNDGPYSFRLGPQTEIPKGASGGPVIDLSQGALVGLTKASRRTSEGDIKDGGRAVRSTLLREFVSPVVVDPDHALGPDPYYALVCAHDRWHAESDLRDGWTDVQGELPGNGLPDSTTSWSPGDRLELFELLAALPAPDDPTLVRSLLRVVFHNRAKFPATSALRHWRDGHGEIHQYRMQFTIEALPYLRYAKLVALAVASTPGAASTAADLDRWVGRRMRRLGLEADVSVGEVTLPGRVDGDITVQGGTNATGILVHPGGHAQNPPLAAEPVQVGILDARPGDGPSVLLELEPALWSPSAAFHWRLRVLDPEQDDDAVVDADENGDGVPPDDLPLRLQRPLARLFLQLDTPERHAPLEVVLPPEHFDLAVQHWLPQAAVTDLDLSDPACWPLGVRRQVVVRDASRRGGVDPLWEMRWKDTAAAAPLRALPTPQPGRLLRRAGLAGAGPDQVPVVCRPAADATGREVLRLALESGHGVFLWNAGSHPPDGCDERCRSFSSNAARLLADAGSAAELPERLRVLRERIHRRDPHAYWAKPLALMYDDADRPLAEPAGVLDAP
ncbi:serine protease [Streptomyces pluripotens]|uniref:Serine protease n=1 Tax=Streptomyces pluripotens TaxID=1355015 RepID=A0A221P4F7_9ACTN|nr:trypsin-like peptidase domain-containing protein [Streptomyces pluripotens]ARP72764.1 serine protease [Streptomyces pluripotens]ASN27014.1 serine protease [Streptomyces pluripotens]